MNSRNTYILKRARVFMSLHFTCGGEVNSRQGRPLTTTRSRTDFDYRLQRAPPPPGAGWLQFQTSRATVWRAPRGECLSGLAEGLHLHNGDAAGPPTKQCIPGAGFRTCDRTQRFHPPLGRNCSGATRTHHPYGLNKGILYCTPLCATATSMNCLLSRHRFRHATPDVGGKGVGVRLSVRPSAGTVAFRCLAFHERSHSYSMHASIPTCTLYHLDACGLVAYNWSPHYHPRALTTRARTLIMDRIPSTLVQPMPYLEGLV
jgi:hypothetical protein